LPIVEEENTNATTNKNETVEQVQAAEPIERREDNTETSQNKQNPYLSTEILVEHK
jgi:hypothetical protein